MSYANTGMRHPVWAPIVSETDGSEPTYGSGRVVQEAIDSVITFNTDSGAVLYADDVVVDMDDGITGYTVSFNPSGIRDGDRAAMLGEEAVTGGVYEITDAPKPWGGFGFFRVMRDGETQAKFYEAWWCRKIKFRETTMQSHTKEGTIQWRTPTLDGTGAGLFVDSSGAVKYIKHKTFETAGAAKAWLDGLANISAVTT